MSGRSLPGTLFQIGYVVPNLDAALAHLNATLGAPRFMVLREIVVENGWFRGGPAAINHSMAFGYVGDVQFEVIEPVSGKSTYSEFLDRVPAAECTTSVIPSKTMTPRPPICWAAAIAWCSVARSATPSSATLRPPPIRGPLPRSSTSMRTSKACSPISRRKPSRTGTAAGP
jgi:Glyoxalase/Bleomycin resistance protein/Dioxygenase superfamily